MLFLQPSFCFFSLSKREEPLLIVSNWQFTCPCSVPFWYNLESRKTGKIHLKPPKNKDICGLFGCFSQFRKCPQSLGFIYLLSLFAEYFHSPCAPKEFCWKVRVLLKGSRGVVVFYLSNMSIYWISIDINLLQCQRALLASVAYQLPIASETVLLET